MPRQIVDPETGDKRFDARVHIRNHHGKTVEERHYNCISRDGIQYFTDKNGWYYADGSDIPKAVLIAAGLEKPQPKKEAPKQAQAPAPAPVQPIPAGNPDRPDQGPPNADQPVQPEGGEDEPNPEPPAPSDDQGSAGL